MKNFITIILRNQFNLFYRFGYTYIDSNFIYEFDGNITNIKNEIIEKLFSKITPFEYDEEYLILHFEKNIIEQKVIQFEIEDLVAIYPLSQQAKRSIENKIDTRIKLEEPIFESVIEKIEKNIQESEVIKGIQAIWSVCDFDSKWEYYVEKIGLDNIYKGLEFRQKGIKPFNLINENYWKILIAYDRYDYYPNSSLGYFYDAAQIFAHFKGHVTAEGSGVYNFLEKINNEIPNPKFSNIIEFIQKEVKLESYVSQNTEGDLKKYIIAPLFLMLKDEIRNAENINETKLFKNLDYLKNFGEDFKYSCVLLGAFFGYKKFYDSYYDTLKLRFYKDSNPISNFTEELFSDFETISNNIEDIKVQKNNITPKDTKELEINIIEDLLDELYEFKLTVLKKKIKDELKILYTVDELKDILNSSKINFDYIDHKTSRISSKETNTIRKGN
ncbi:hypothetical protein OBK29_13100 [Empedobacter falsenii]|uniref:hypothetical protein n=1 Tax=Empedobacter falsenii TaxID=343874 RepID=UPI003A8045BF